VRGRKRRRPWSGARSGCDFNTPFVSCLINLSLQNASCCRSCHASLAQRVHAMPLPPPRRSANPLYEVWVPAAGLLFRLY
jgi:hypothetical protein